MMMGSFISRTLVMAFGYAYPAYECYKIAEKRELEILQLLFWCHYWIIVALLTVFERFGEPLISWFPLYHEAKLAFFIYLWHPKTKGAACVFGLFLRPLIVKHETEIDHYLTKLRLKTGEIASLFWHKTRSCSQTTLLDLLHNVSSLPSPETRRNPAPEMKNLRRSEDEADAVAVRPVSGGEIGLERNQVQMEKKGFEDQDLKVKRHKWRLFRPSEFRRWFHFCVSCLKVKHKRE